jgi:hypothetical protein
MLFFMVFTSHSAYSATVLSGGKSGAYWLIALVIIAVLELNCLGMLPWKAEMNKGLNALYDNGVKGTIISAVGLWVVFLILTEVLFKP